MCAKPMNITLLTCTSCVYGQMHTHILVNKPFATCVQPKPINCTGKQPICCQSPIKNKPLHQKHSILESADMHDHWIPGQTEQPECEEEGKGQHVYAIIGTPSFQLYMCAWLWLLPVTSYTYAHTSAHIKLQATHVFKPQDIFSYQLNEPYLHTTCCSASYMKMHILKSTAPAWDTTIRCI